jgi:glutamate racemase
MGGLTVRAEIARALPAESLVYFGDGANAPYGGRTRDEITRLTSKAVERLIAHDIKLLVVACNAATGAAIDHLRATFDIPIVGMEPAVKPAALTTQTGTIGVLATAAAFRGELYKATAARFGKQTQTGGPVPLEEPGEHAQSEKTEEHSPLEKPGSHSQSEKPGEHASLEKPEKPGEHVSLEKPEKPGGHFQSPKNVQSGGPVSLEKPGEHSPLEEPGSHSQSEKRVNIVETVGEGFVELVENDLEESPEAFETVRRAVEPMLAAGADRIVLGCTHYPFLAPQIRRAIYAWSRTTTTKNTAADADGAAVAEHTANETDGAASAAVGGANSAAERLPAVQIGDPAQSAEAESSAVQIGDPIKTAAGWLGAVQIVDSAPAIARRTAQILAENDLQAAPDHTPRHEFLTAADETYRQKLIRKSEKATP